MHRAPYIPGRRKNGATPGSLPPQQTDANNYRNYRFFISQNPTRLSYTRCSFSYNSVGIFFLLLHCNCKLFLAHQTTALARAHQYHGVQFSRSRFLREFYVLFLTNEGKIPHPLAMYRQRSRTATPIPTPLARSFSCEGCCTTTPEVMQRPPRTRPAPTPCSGPEKLLE